MEECWEEMFQKFAEFGEIEDLIIVDNLEGAFDGNVFVKFYCEEAAARCLEKLQSKWFLSIYN